MKRVAVVTDSTSNLPPELVEKYDIPIIPLNVHWGEETYLDGITIDVATFYRWLQEREDFPTTSQPSAGAFMEFFQETAKRFKTDTILGAFISADLSGTCASAHLAKKGLPELHIEVFDSRSVSLGVGFNVLAAARMTAEGAPLEEILAHIEKVRASTELIFTVDTLEYLHRGGRIGGAARLLGTVLNLKPVLTIEDGRVDALQKVRSRRKSLQQIIDIAAERLDGRRPEELAIVHAEADEDLDMFTEWVTTQLRPKRLYTVVLSPVVGTHGGPGTLGVTFYPEL